jgi:hypothetical protein
MPDECRERIIESRRVLIEKSEEINKNLIENDYWTDSINLKNISTLKKNNGNNNNKKNYLIFLFNFICFLFFIKF